MSIRNILVPVRGDGKGERLMDHAVLMAKALDAHLDVFHARVRARDLLTFGAPLARLMQSDIKEVAEKHAAAEEERVRKLFDDYCEKNGVTITDQPGAGGGVTASWHEESGKQSDVISRKGRLTDLILVSKPDEDGGQNTFEAALLETGRPVIMAPTKRGETIGEKIAIAWNGSAEAAGAVVNSRPILERAEEILVLTDPNHSDQALDADELARYLILRGKSPRIIKMSAAAHKIGQMILRVCGREDVDLLIMGGFGQMHRRELVMGGVTEYIVANADIPVLFRH